jgi:RNA ligase
MIVHAATLRDVVDLDLLAYYLEQGFVRRQSHPTLPLDIYNYSQKCQFASAWDQTTRACRGLIVERGTDRIVARPFPKFFNWGEVENNNDFKTTGQVAVTDKMDGSLGIVYRYRGHTAIATRGSFTSPQAVAATRILKEKYPDFIPYDHATYLFEIVYPTNRIVLDYGQTEDLFLLDIISNDTGRTLLHHANAGPYFRNWTGPEAEALKVYSLSQALAFEPRPNKEGMVVYFKDHDTRVKIKQDDYVRLHRILTNVSTKTIWEFLRDGQDINQIIENVPDEFFQWVKDQIWFLTDEYMKVADSAHTGYVRIMATLADYDDEREKRKAFAEQAKKWPYTGIMFGYYDDKDVAAQIWKLVKPEYSKPFMEVCEDVA